jgi:tripartite-type tricarboxylate transporter receptor subunit TctC
MKLPRRQFLLLAGGAAALPGLSRIARAQAYPARPVRIIVGFAAGGPADILARLMGQWLSERLGQPFVIENRPGGGSNIGTEVVVRAPADGYTLLMVGTPGAINATLYDKLNFNFIRDIAPVAGVIRASLVMVVHPSMPTKTVPEFIAYAKANPGKINMASGGVGTSPHVAGELFGRSPLLRRRSLTPRLQVRIGLTREQVRALDNPRLRRGIGDGFSQRRPLKSAPWAWAATAHSCPPHH